MVQLIGQYFSGEWIFVDPTGIDNIYERVDITDFDGMWGLRTFSYVVGMFPNKGTAYLGELTDEDGVFIATRSDDKTLECEDRMEALKFLVRGENHEA